MPSVTIGEACPLAEPCASKSELAQVRRNKVTH